MEFLYPFVLILIIALWLSDRLKKSISLTFSLAMIFIMLSEYVFGLFSNLISGDIFIKGISLLFIADILRRHNFAKLKKYIDSSLFLYIVFYVLSILVLKEKIVYEHNELLNWGLYSKTFFINDEMLNANSSVLNSGYIPTLSLIEYWFAHQFKNFYDGLFYIINSFFSFSLVISVCYMIKSKYKFLITILTIFILPYVSNLIYNYLFVETAIGLLFALSILFCIIYNKSKKNAYTFAIITSGLALIKISAFLFILISFFIVLTDFNIDLKKRIKYLLPSVLTFIFIIISWKLYIVSHGLNQTWDMSGFKFPEIISVFSGQGLSYQNNILYNFYKALCSKEYSVVSIGSFHIPTIILYVLTLLIVSICYIINKKDYKLRYILNTVIISNLLYLASLLIMYTFSFCEWEALSFSALKRYLQVLNISNTIFIIYISFSYSLIKIKNPNILPLSKCLFLILILLSQKSWYIEKLGETYSPKENYFNKYISQYMKHLNNKDKILLVTQYINTYNSYREISLLRFRYEIAPYNVYMTAETNLSENEIKDKLSCDYTYIYFDNCTDEVLNKYSFLSNNKIVVNKLYKIIKDDNNLNFHIEEIK